MYYVYGLIDPRDGKIFYIGKGKNNRMYSHTECVKNNIFPNRNNEYLYNKIKSILNDGYENVLYTKFFESDDEGECYIMEKNIILEYKNTNVKLCNLTDGGEGFSDPTGEIAIKISKSNKGRIINENWRKNISNGVMGEKNPFFGKNHSDETKKKISESLKNKESNFKGKEHSEESKLKNRLSHLNKAPWNKGIPMSDESKKKMSETKKGKIPWNKGKEINYNKTCKICNKSFKTLTDWHMVKKHNITLQEYKTNYDK